MDRLGPELRRLLAEAVRNARHTHNAAYGRALAIEEMMQAVEAELTDSRYAETERKSVHRITLAVMDHGRQMTR
jgi:hypothetical protein